MDFIASCFPARTRTVYRRVGRKGGLPREVTGGGGSRPRQERWLLTKGCQLGRREGVGRGGGGGGEIRDPSTPPSPTGQPSPGNGLISCLLYFGLRKRVQGVLDV